MRPTPRAIPVSKALPVLIPATTAVWLLIPDTRPILALLAIILCVAAACAWSQTHAWSPRARTVTHVAVRALGWVLTSAGHVLRFLGLIIRAILWAASLLAFLSIVGYALGLCGDGNRHYR